MKETTDALTATEKRWLAVFTRIEELKSLDEVSARDVTTVVKTLKEYPSSQFLRRTLIRNFAAHVDGEVFMMKQVTLALSRVRKGFSAFSRKDLALLAEERAYLDESGQEQKLVFPAFLENFKFAFKNYAKVNGFTFTLVCNDQRYPHFLEMVRVRHRLMHPKSPRDFYIEDEELIRIGKAWTWYQQQATRLLSTRGDPSGLQTKFFPVEDHQQNVKSATREWDRRCAAVNHRRLSATPLVGTRAAAKGGRQGPLREGLG